MDKFGLNTAGNIAYLSLAVGITLLLVSFSINFVIMYPSMMNYGLLAAVFGCTLVFVVIFCIIGFYYTPHLNGAMRVGFSKIMQNYNARSEKNIYLDGIQEQIKCCGTDNYMSWFQTSWADGKRIVPASCCKNLKFCHNLEPLIVTDIYEKGCFKVFDNYSAIVDGSYIGTIIGSLAIQFLAIASAIKMALRYRTIRLLDSVLPMV
ncbi:uncharacterized protein TNCT_584961 [Trichonephila clavata]|uniref:Tetraspanin n=1 Tax=Trichonephila clavata TaxID=2740835 RepID=A0A8X6HPJ9_TRICU|nr:uncharacterized protein TNCT_584961 [Trichonephila clavata]